MEIPVSQQIVMMKLASESAHTRAFHMLCAGKVVRKKQSVTSVSLFCEYRDAVIFYFLPSFSMSVVLTHKELEEDYSVKACKICNHSVFCSMSSLIRPPY